MFPTDIWRLILDYAKPKTNRILPSDFPEILILYDDVRLREMTHLGGYSFPKMRSLELVDACFDGIGTIFPNLRKLSFEHEEGLTSIEGLQALSQLEELNLSLTGVVDLSPLAGLTRLKKLWLEDVEDLRGGLEPIQGLNLEYLDISGSNIDEIYTWPNLKLLNVSATNVKSLKPLADCVQLTDLNISVTKVSDLTHIKNLEHLKYLDIMNMKYTVRGLWTISNFHKLELLRIGGQHDLGDLDLSDWRSLKNIELVVLSDCNISDISFMHTWEDLFSVSLVDNPELSNVWPLLDKRELKYIQLKGTKVFNKKQFDDLPNLKQLRMSKIVNPLEYFY